MNLRAGSLDDWYVVDGCFGQPEGSAEEWLLVIELINRRESGQAGDRVGLDIQDDGAVHLFSPKNQSGDRDIVRIPAEKLSEWMDEAVALLVSSQTSAAPDRKWTREELEEERQRLMLRESEAVMQAERDAARADENAALCSEMLSALKLALGAMNHMGEVMNQLEIVEKHDIEITAPAFQAVRAIIAKVQQEEVR